MKVDVYVIYKKIYYILVAYIKIHLKYINILMYVFYNYK